MSIKLVVCDLDGTLLHDDKTMDCSIQSIVESNPGFKLTIASGRNFHIVQDIVNQLHIDIPYILNNGANMWIENKCIFNATMDSKQLEKACHILCDYNISFLAYTNNCIYSMGSLQRLNHFMQRLKGKCNLVYNANIRDFISKEVFKVIMIDPNMEQVKAVINQNCVALQCVQSEGEVYSLTSKLASKGTTLSRLMQQMGLSKEEVLVFGDNFNDVSMFKVATGIAMGNATQPLKDVAYATTLTNEDDGVSNYLLKHVVNI